MLAPGVQPAISGDGRYVASGSSASNLVAGDTNGASDVFVHNQVTGSTTRVSVATGDTQANDASYSPAISADGRYVVFISEASNRVAGDTNGTSDVFVRARLASATTPSVTSTATAGRISSPGRPRPDRFISTRDSGQSSPPWCGSDVVRTLRTRSRASVTSTWMVTRMSLPA